MKYPCGTDVELGDEVLVELGPQRRSPARVVAIGLDQTIGSIDRSFYDWAKEESIIKASSVVIEWLGTNPLEHNDSSYAQVGDYMTLSSVSSETFVRRGPSGRVA